MNNRKRGLTPDDSPAWQTVLEICRRADVHGGRAHLVGGSVRDRLIGHQVHDFDLEVFGLDGEALERMLAKFTEVDPVGRSFGVLKVKHLPIDIALPRRERKVGTGHRGFETLADPEMSPEDAAARRDFTINAIAWDPLRDRLIDPWGGARDLDRGILRHTSERFAEDPLRVLRGMQFIARFELSPAPETVQLARTMGLEGLAPERIFEEWRKYFLEGRAMSRGLWFLRSTGWIQYFPEIAALIDCPQDPIWHPEGSVFRHTGFVLDAFAADRIALPHEDLRVGLACLCHDFGKPATTRLEGGRWRSRHHDSFGVHPTQSFLRRMTNQEDLIADVCDLVADHLRPRQLWEVKAGDAAIRRLARRIGRIDRLVRVARADSSGRPPLPPDDGEAADWLLAKAQRLELEASAPQPLVLGRHLIARGLAPGPHFGPMLDAAFEAQLDGTFDDERGALAWLDQYLASKRD